MNDATAIGDLDDIGAFAPISVGNAQIIYAGNNSNTPIVGTTPSYFSIRRWDVESGELFSDADVRSANRVALVGKTVVENLFGDDIKSSPNKPTQMGSKGEIKVKSEGGDMSAVIAAINNLASRPINVKTSVQLDGKELATMQGKYPNEAGDANGKVAYKIA
jgi:hypothetical protein